MPEGWLRRHWSSVLGTLVGLCFLGLAFWGVAPGELLDALQHIRPLWLLPIALAFVLQELTRAVRQLLLLRPLLPSMSLGRSVSVVFIGFFCVHVLPMRLGELARPLLLRRQEGLPFTSGLAVVVALRALDLLATLAMLLLVLIFVDAPESLVIAGVNLHLADMLHSLGWGLVLPTLAFTVGLAFWGEPLQRAVVDPVLGLVARLDNPVVQRLVALASGLLERFTLGLAGLRSPRLLGLSLLLTVGVWSWSCSMYWMTARALGLGDWVGWPEALGVMVITMVGSLLPAPPGMAGVQEAFGRGGLALFGVRGPGLDPVALAFAVVVHWYQVLLQTLGALWFIRREGFSVRELLSMVRGHAEAEVAQRGAASDRPGPPTPPTGPAALP